MQSLKITLDQTVLYIRQELRAFEEFLTVSEDFLATARTMRHADVSAEEEVDEASHYEERELAIEAADRMYPRYWRSANIVTLYALLESSLDRLAKGFQMKLGIEVSENDNDQEKEGHDQDESAESIGSLHNLRTHFRQVLDVPIYEGNDRALWERLIILMTIRHAIAHDGGRYERSKHRSKLESWNSQNKLKGVSLDEWEASPISVEGYLSFEAEYLQRAFNDVNAILQDLLARYERLKIQPKSEDGSSDQTSSS